MKKLSRRTFLRLSGTTAVGVAVSASGCSGSAPSSIPAATATNPPPATPTATTVPTIEPTATAEPQRNYRRPEVIKFHPDVKSRVVRARNAKVWNGDTLSSDILRQMVDQSITALTGMQDAKAAWQALFKPEERIAIKVNAFRNSTIWTHPQLVKAVTDGLQDAGIPGENITLFDYTSEELTTAGFTINKDGPGVRCYGTDMNYAARLSVGGKSVPVSDILMNTDALINIPVLKSHMIAGMTFALKNHYGSVAVPDYLHDVEASLVALNAIHPIKEATRLVIGDILEANTKYQNAYPYWSADARGDSILMSFDPLAHDRIGLDILTKMAEEKGNSIKGILGMCDLWLNKANEAGIGTCDPSHIELKEI